MNLHILSGERSRSSFKVKCQIYDVSASENFNIGLNFFNIEDSNLVFGMHVSLMKLHILSGGSSRSRSSFKDKGQQKNSMRHSHETAHFEWWKFKVKVILQGQGYPWRSNKNSKLRYHEAAHFEWWKFKAKVILQGLGYPSRSKVKQKII